MLYPVAIEPGTGTTAFGVVVPDLPGCFSAGDTLDEAMAGAEEAAIAWMDATLNAGQVMPAPTTLDAIRQHAAYANWMFGFVHVEEPRRVA